MNEEKKDFSMIDLLNVPVDYGRGYESPINLIQNIADEITEMHDNSIYMKVCEIVDVDKEELLKALEEAQLDIKLLKMDLPELFRPSYDGGYLRG